MPDKNAAAQRVLSIAKAFREFGYETFFYGITQTDEFEGDVDGFHYEACRHPKSIIAWLKYAIGDGILKYIKDKSPDFVFLYNYPAVAQERVIKYCRKKGIKTIGDITEWRHPPMGPVRVDTYLRMTFSNKHLDGIIVISKYLSDFYKGKFLIQLPPMVDKHDTKWDIQPKDFQKDIIKLVYIGTGSVKDRLDKIIKGIQMVESNRLHLDVIGINGKQYADIYKQSINPTSRGVVFHGRLPHKEALSFLKGADFQIFFRDQIRKNNAGFPTKFVESMSAGVPVITNRISNIEDYVRNGENSFMIEHPEEGEICEILKQVSTLSRDEIENIKSKCLKEEFDYRKYVKQLESFMEGLKDR